MYIVVVTHWLKKRLIQNSNMTIWQDILGSSLHSMLAMFGGHACRVLHHLLGHPNRASKTLNAHYNLRNV